MYALAAAHYGVIVRERSGTAPSFERESPYPIYWKACPNGVCSNGVPINPYTGRPFGDTGTPTSTSIFAGYKLWQVMSNFPWSKMQVETMVTCAIPSGACPTVSISTPAAGATVTGTVTISGRPMPNIGAAIAGVQFKVDGVNTGAEDTTAPYSVSWNTTGVSNGTHLLTATTRDTSNRRSETPPVQITVDSPATSSGTAVHGATVSLSGVAKRGARALTRLKIRKLLRKGGFTLTFTAPGPGVMTAKLTAAGRKAALARGRHVYKAAGKAKLKAKLTKAGRKRLRKARRLKAELTLSFAPAGGKVITTTSKVWLKR
jgi:hypothetical protein